MDARYSSRIAASQREHQGDDIPLLPDPVQALSPEDGSLHPDPDTVPRDTDADGVVPIPISGRRTERVTSTEAYTGVPFGAQSAHATTPRGASDARAGISMGAYAAHAGTLGGAQAAHAEAPPTELERMFASIAAAATRAYQEGFNARGRSDAKRKRYIRSGRRGGSQSSGPSPRDTGRRSHGGPATVPVQGGRDRSQDGSTGFRQGGSQTDRAKCWRCGRRGHRQSDCRVPQCYTCSEIGHRQIDCPTRRAGAPPATAAAQAHTIQPDEGARDTSVMRGILIIEFCVASILFDTRTSSSFISLGFTYTLGLESTDSHGTLTSDTLLGTRVILSQICSTGLLRIDDHYLTYELVVIVMSLFDIILGMD